VPQSLIAAARFALQACAAAGLAACAAYPEAGFGSRTSAVSVPDAPFIPQDRYQCGPAALLTVLTYSGAATSMETMVNRVYIPGREGSLQDELVAAARSEGRIPYVIEPSLAAVGAELDAGRPVLVLQNLGVDWIPRWHYAVVFGVDPDGGLVHLRSGTDRDRATRVPVFLRTWARSGFWGLVVLRPGELPADPDPDRFYTALAALDATGHGSTSLASWQAAADAWPDSTTPVFALGNHALGTGDFAVAEVRYRAVLAMDPRHVAARNNLAYVLAATGRRDAAVEELERALAEPALPPHWRAELEGSMAEIAAGGMPMP
jgi:hypothetical protein